MGERAWDGLLNVRAGFVILALDLPVPAAYQLPARSKKVCNKFCVSTEVLRLGRVERAIFLVG